MKRHIAGIISVVILLSTCFSCQQRKKEIIRSDFKKFFDEFHVQGSFALYDLNKDFYTFYNKEQFTQKYTPPSTFKICNSLIGLETGVVCDEHFVIKWDSVKRQVPAWNHDHDMEMAFKNSTVWYYQEIARRIGGKRMKYWLDKAHYGNADTTGGIDKFWLSGNLRISPEQQIDFLKRFYKNELPFSKRSVDIVKKIMIVEKTNDFVMRAKSGWGLQNNTDIGWYIGYVEKENQVYFFSTCIQNTDTSNTGFPKARIEITKNILKALKII
jgi:beta-lactamase class D